MAQTKPRYLMEGTEESERLFSKTDLPSTKEQLVSHGLLDAGKNIRIVDAGSGSGMVSKAIAEILEDQVHISLLDLSNERLNDASRLLQGNNVHKFSYVKCDLGMIPLKSDTYDFIFSRFVFEYIENQQLVFDELYRLLKPGPKSRLMIGDLDYNCLSHFPLPKDLDEQLHQMTQALSDLKLFDPHAGRKLYHYFHKKEMKDIKVTLHAHHLFYGKLSKTDYDNWSLKFVRIADMQEHGQIKLNFDAKEFAVKFMHFLASEDRFTYTPLIIVSGSK